MAGSSGGGFGVSVWLNDDATKGLDKINRSIAAMNAPAQRAAKSLAKFGDVTGVTRLSEGMGNLGHEALGAFRSVDRISGPLELITGAGSIAGMTALVSRFAALGTRLVHTSYSIGMAAEDLSKYEQAAGLSGVAAQSVDQAFQGLSDTLNALQFHKQTEAQQRFADVMTANKVALLDAQGVARPTADVFRDLAGVLSKISGTRNKLLLLDMAGVPKDMFPALMDGVAGWDAAVKKAQDLGGIVTPKMLTDATAASKSFWALAEAIEGVGNRLADKAAPAVTHWMDLGATWISKNKGIADSIAEIGTAIGLMAAAKPAAWLLKLLGFSTGAAVATTAATGAGIIAATTSFAPEPKGLHAFEVKEAQQAIDHANRSDPQHVRTLGDRAADFWQAITPGHRIPDRQSWEAGDQAPSGAPLGAGSWASPNTKSWAGRGKWGHVAPAPGPQSSNGAGQASGFANNNPGNLEYAEGQPGVQGRSGRWGVYATPEAGAAASLHQMLLDQDKGYNTVRSEVSHRSPPSENDTGEMVSSISKWSGLDADAPYDLRDPAVARRFLAATIQREQGKAPDPGMIDRAATLAGVPNALGAPGGAASKWSGLDADAPYDLRDPAVARRFLAATIQREQGKAPDPGMIDRAATLAGVPNALGAPGGAGTVHVEIALTGAPAGTTAKVITKGAVTASPPRIETAMAGAG